MKIIGISPLDKDATVCLVENGQVQSAIAEERLSRRKMHAGFPYLALQAILERHGLTPADVDKVVYAFNDWPAEAALIDAALEAHEARSSRADNAQLIDAMRSAPAHQPPTYGIPGLEESALYMHKSPAHRIAYKSLATVAPLAETFAARKRANWRETAVDAHRHWSGELAKGLEHFGLADKLERVDHHLTHAANAFYQSGFDEALIVTLDGYGSGLGGSVSIGRGSSIERVHDMQYPNSLGEFYERVTSSLGFVPGRHEGKIVGLAAYDSPDVLYDTVRQFFHVEAGEIHYRLPHNFAFARYLAERYSKPAVAAAWQKVLEDVCGEYVRHHLEATGLENVVLSGGVVANVKANQRIFEVPGVQRVFVHPNMGDGGCSVGAALVASNAYRSLSPHRINDVYWGQDYSDAAIADVLERVGLEFTKADDIEHDMARLLADGEIVARFNGRMEYGPRSLGNRSILYHAKDPSVNLWLNQRLNRTEFMPFAPATLYEERHANYRNMDGADYAAGFMTVTFDCTETMQADCPAAVHVDGTARPQLVSEQSNPSFHRVLKEYQRLTGVASVINTSFNMHEEPIVCTPEDAVRAFLLGDLPYLAIGNYLVPQPTGSDKIEATERAESMAQPQGSAATSSTGSAGYQPPPSQSSY